MRQARLKEPARWRRRWLGTARDGCGVAVVVDARPDGSSSADSLEMARQQLAQWTPQPLAFDNAALVRLPLPPSGRGKIERALSWLEQAVVFGRRRRRHP